jgi:CxxC motif-containing protein
MDTNDGFACIICPRGCHIETDQAGAPIGARCARGLAWAVQELEQPKRIVCTSILVTGGTQPLVSVKTDRPVARESMKSIVSFISGMTVTAPIGMYQVLVENPAGIACNLLATQPVASR